MAMDLFNSNANYISTRTERIRMSRHAQKRCQQRGGKEDQIPLIKAFGEPEHDGRGAIRYTMTETAMQHLYRSCGYGKKLEKLKGMYIVVSHEDGTVITVAHLQH